MAAARSLKSLIILASLRSLESSIRRYEGYHESPVRLPVVLANSTDMSALWA
jgi:hypothetical protein